MSLVCLDVGRKRIGVAKSDDLGIAAHPLTVIERKGLAMDLDAVVELCRKHRPVTVVVGLPLDQENREGPAARAVRGFVVRLAAALADASLDIPIETWDERYSTAEAEEMLIEADVTRAKRRKVIDKMAAARILQSYMEHRKGTPWRCHEWSE